MVKALVPIPDTQNISMMIISTTPSWPSWSTPFSGNSLEHEGHDGDTTDTTGESNADARAMGDALNAKVKAVIAQETRQGGIIWKYQQGRG